MSTVCSGWRHPSSDRLFTTNAGITDAGVFSADCSLVKRPSDVSAGIRSFTEYADESVWSSLERRIPQALVVQEPSENPYLQWILKGRYESALPWSWRRENYDRIRQNLDAIEWHCEPIEQVLSRLPDGTLNGCNLSDIFEYMSGPAYRALLFGFIRASAPGCRLVYWNLVVDRSRPEMFEQALVPLKALAQRLHDVDKAFFYRNLVIEEVA